MTAATHNVRKMVVDGKHRMWRALEVHGKYWEAGLNTNLFSRKHVAIASLCWNMLDTWCIAMERAETEVVGRRAKTELGWLSKENHLIC